MPANPVKTAESSHNEAMVMADSSLACLVVDDNPVNHTMAVSFLLPHNIKPDTSLSGSEALRMIKEKAGSGSAYDIILMDHMMPGMDGIETTGRIREWEKSTGKGQPMPIIAFSANTSEGTEKMFLDAGMNGFISKPIIAEELNRILKQWLPAGKTSSAKAQTETKDPKTRRLLEELANIKGLDVKAGFENFAQRGEAYFLALRQFSENCDSYIEGLKADGEKEAWGDYSIKAHAQKGVLAAFGMGRLSQWAENLEKASKNGEGFSPEICREETAPFCTALAKFRDMLRLTPLFDSSSAEKGEKPKGEEKFFQTQINNLREACKGGSSEDIEKTMAALLKYEWDSETLAKLEKITTLTSSYHFEEALEKIELIGQS